MFGKKQEPATQTILVSDYIPVSEEGADELRKKGFETCEVAGRVCISIDQTLEIIKNTILRTSREADKLVDEVDIYKKTLEDKEHLFQEVKKDNFEMSSLLAELRVIKKDFDTKFVPIQQELDNKIKQVNNFNIENVIKTTIEQKTNNINLEIEKSIKELQLKSQQAKANISNIITDVVKQVESSILIINNKFSKVNSLLNHYLKQLNIEDMKNKILKVKTMKKKETENNISEDESEEVSEIEETEEIKEDKEEIESNNGEKSSNLLDFN